MFRTATRFAPTRSSHAAPRHLEWGPAHHRDEAVAVEVEPADRPDDN